MKMIFEHLPGQPVPDGAVDGMEAWINEFEQAGFEGEHVFDVMLEDPPHPWWPKKSAKVPPDQAS